MNLPLDCIHVIIHFIQKHKEMVSFLSTNVTLFQHRTKVAWNKQFVNITIKTYTLPYYDKFEKCTNKMGCIARPSKSMRTFLFKPISYKSNNVDYVDVLLKHEYTNDLRVQINMDCLNLQNMNKLFQNRSIKRLCFMNPTIRLNDIIWPTHLHTLTLKTIKNVNLSDLPKTLEKLSIIDVSLINGDFLSLNKLTYLKVNINSWYATFNIPIPESVKKLFLGGGIVDISDVVLKEGLEEIYILTCDITLKKLPKSLKRVYHKNREYSWTYDRSYQLRRKELSASIEFIQV